MASSRLDFPLPLGPITATAAPTGIRKVPSATATWSPWDRRMPRASTATGAGSTGPGSDMRMSLAQPGGWQRPPAGKSDAGAGDPWRAADPGVMHQGG